MKLKRSVLAMLLLALFLAILSGLISAQGKNPQISGQSYSFASGREVGYGYFSNATALTIVDAGNSDTPQPATPLYPSSVTVSGVEGNITLVQVNLLGLNHNFADDVDIMLVGPGGQSIRILSDAWGTGFFSNTTLHFRDDAAAKIADAAANEGDVLPGGEYQISNYDPGIDVCNADAFPAPAPFVSSSATLAEAFNGLSGADVNGQWDLYVTDDCTGDAGTISGGWQLYIFTDAVPTNTPTYTPTNTPTVTDTPTATATYTPTNTPVVTDTPTSTPTPVQVADLLTNGSFEDVNGNPSLDSWKLVTATQDKLKCNKVGKPPVAFDGECSFRFKIGVNDTVILSQKAHLTGWTPAATHHLVYAYQAMTPGSTAIYLGYTTLVKYSDGTAKDKFGGDIVDELTADQWLSKTNYETGGSILSSTAVKVIKVKFYLYPENTGGKIYVDAVSLKVYDFSGAGMLPLPQNSFGISSRK